MLNFGLFPLSLLALGVKISSCAEEREVSNYYIPYPDQILTIGQYEQNSIQKTTKVTDGMDCNFACNDEHWCESINFKTNAESDGSHVCELLSGNRFMNGSTMTEKSGYIHYHVEVGLRQQLNSVVIAYAFY